MSTGSPIGRFFARWPLAAAALYAVAFVVCGAVIWTAAADILADRATLISSKDLLRRLEAHRDDPGAAPAGAIPAGSPFLGGETITVAGAELLQRVAAAITRYGGSIQSSQVDLQGPQSKGDFVTLMVSCEIDEANLQKLLYDVEAGMPYLFVDQLTARAPQVTPASLNARMSVLLAVSGRWSGKK